MSGGIMGGGSASTVRVLLAQEYFNESANTTSFQPLFWSGAGFSSGETNIGNIISFAMTLTRARIRVNTNGKATANPVVSLRDDGASIGSVTVTLGVTGDFDSGVISTAIAAGSVIGILVDTTGCTGTALTCNTLFELTAP